MVRLWTLRRLEDEIERRAGVCYVAAAIIGSAAIGAVASHSGGGGTTTVVNTPPPQTPAESEAEQLRLEELRRQNDLAEKMLPNQTALIEQQRQMIQYQIDHQGDLDALHAAQLKLAQAQIQQQINDAAMQQQLQPEQLKFLQNQNALAIQQISSMSQATAAQTEQNKYVLEQLQDQHARLQARNAAYSPEEEAQAAADEARRASRMSAISEEAANIQLQNLKQGTKPTDEQLANINESYDAAQKIGESDISKFLTDTQRQITEENAQAAGLRATDAPIVRLSERAGEEAARQQGELTRSVEQGRATARLNYPLAAEQLSSNTAGQLQSLTAGAANFQDQLRQAAAMNRTQAFSMPQSVGFAMPQQTPPTNLSFMSPMGTPGVTDPNAFNFNFFRGGGTQTSTAPFLQTAGQLAGGVGSFMSGYARMFPSGTGS